MHIKKTLRNAMVGLITQTIIIALGLLVPRLVMVHFGSDTNGFTATVAQIFTYMALLEAGIGQSTLNSLYEPVSKNDRESISRKMTASRSYYRKVTRLYALLVLVMTAVLPFLLNTNIDKFVAAQVVFFEGMSYVIAFYFLEAWKQLLAADGKQYIVHYITTVYSVLGYSTKIILIYANVNIGMIQVAYFIVSIIQLIIYQVYFKKYYPWVNFKSNPDDTALKDRYAFMISHIAATIFSSTDMIVISIIGTTSLSSVYSVYGLIFNNLVKILNAIYFGTIYILGQMWQKDKVEYIFLHDAFDIASHCIITATMSIAYVLTIPFVRLYTNGVNDVEYIYEYAPLLFCMIQILSWNRYVSGNLTALAGYAKRVSKVSAIEAIMNLVLSVLFGYFWGIYGVLIATIVSLPVKVIYCVILTNKTILKRTIFTSVKIIISNYIFFTGAVIICSNFVQDCQNYLAFFGAAVLLCLTVYPLCLGYNILLNWKVFKHYWPKIRKRILVRR